MISKHRQVRLRYPPALIELVVILAPHVRTREISSALRLPLSSIYRWKDVHRRSARFHGGSPREIDALLTHCEAHGFAVRDAVRSLVPSLLASRSDTTPDSAESVRDVRHLANLDNQVTIGSLSFPRAPHRGDVSANAVPLRPSSDPPDGRLLIAKLEMDQHYYTRLSLRQLADAVGMNKFHFIRAFRTTFGISPYRYLNAVRVEHAKHILALSRQPVSMVAASVGFSSVSSLNRAFRRFAGRSPSDLLYKIAPALHSHPTIAA